MGRKPKSNVLDRVCITGLKPIFKELKEAAHEQHIAVGTLLRQIVFKWVEERREWRKMR